MRTPRFQLTQDSDFVFIKIYAPYCDLKELEVEFDNQLFMFYCKPFFLRLQLPKPIKETDASNGKFIADTQEFEFKIEKLNKNEHFEDLDMLTKLLETPKYTKDLPQIEVIDSDEDDLNGDSWYVEQNEFPAAGIAANGYGFGNTITDYLDTIQETLTGVLDIGEAIKMTTEERTKARLETENEDFDPNVYLYQFFQYDDVDSLVKLESPWVKPTEFTVGELDILKELPNKEYLMTKQQEMEVLYGLVDILYAFCYDQRAFMFETICESGWAINKISPTLSWFDRFSNLKQVIIAVFRRSLIYPLHRNWRFSQKVLEDLQQLLKNRKFILRAFLQIYQIFNRNSNTDPRYILNRLYIKDYLIFLQKTINLDILITEMDGIEITKNDLGLNISEIEREAVQELLESESSESGSTDSELSGSESSDTELDSDDDDEVENITDNLNLSLQIK